MRDAHESILTQFRGPTLLAVRVAVASFSHPLPETAKDKMSKLQEMWLKGFLRISYSSPSSPAASALLFILGVSLLSLIPNSLPLPFVTTPDLYLLHANTWSVEDQMSSRKSSPDQSDRRTALPIIPASAPWTGSTMPPTNSALPYVDPSHLPNTRMLSQPDLLFEPLGSRLHPVLARTGIPTNWQTLTGNSHLRAIRGMGRIVSDPPSFNGNGHVASVDGSDRGIVACSDHILSSDERTAQHGFHRPAKGKSEIRRCAVAIALTWRSDTDLARRPPDWEWVIENPAKRPKHSNKKRNPLMQRLTIEAGGSCICCYKSKKQCGSAMPCERCSRDRHPCVRGSYSALCVALTVKHEDRYGLHPVIFETAQGILETLKGHLKPSSFPIVVHWNFEAHRYQTTLVSAADQVNLNQADATLGKTLVELLISPQSDLPDDLSKDTHRILSVLAAIKGLSRSFCLTNAAAVKSARVIVFFLMTKYTLELYEVSLRIAKGLYDSLKTKTSAETSKRHVVSYMEVIEDLVSWQWPNSLMSDIFAQVQPRLQGLQNLLRQLFLDESSDSASCTNHSFDSNSPACDILIEVWPQTQEILVPGDSPQDVFYAVNDLLLSDFNESMGNPSASPQTIDPSLLRLSMAWNDTGADDVSTTLYSSDEQAIFSYNIETENTDTTHPPPDAPDLNASQWENTGDSGQDLACIGANFGA